MHSRAFSAAIAALAIASAGCGEDEDRDYPASVRENFINACLVNGNKKGCECTLEKIEANMSFEEYNKEEAAIALGRTPSRDISDAVAECR